MPSSCLADESPCDVVQGTPVVNLRKGLGERLLLGHLVLQGAGDQLLAQAANFEALGYEVGVEQCKQDEEADYERTRDRDFKMDGLLFKSGAEEDGKQTRTHQNAGERYDCPKFPISPLQS